MSPIELARHSDHGPSGIEACPGFRMATPAERAEICNGAGPAGWGWIVPDTMWGLWITLAADIHDWDYHWGKTPADRKAADDRFHRNLITLINAEGGILRGPRYIRAYEYWLAVRIFGRGAFLAGKVGKRGKPGRRAGLPPLKIPSRAA